MTYIKLDSDMSLTVTSRETIYRGDNLSKSITFLVPTALGDDKIPAESTTIFLSYVGSDGEPDMDILERSDAMYNADYYQYVLPVTCKLSRYPGQILMWLQVCSGDMNNPIIAKTGECYITIHNSKSLDDCMSDHQLTALYKLKKQVDALAGNDDSSDNEWSDMPEDDNSQGEDGEVWEDM